MADTNPVESSRTARITELRMALDAIDAELITLGNKDVLSEAEEERWQDLLAERDAVAPEYEKLEERARRTEDIQKKTYRQLKGVPEFRTPTDELLGKDLRRVETKVLRDAALRTLDDKDASFLLKSQQSDQVEHLIRTDPSVAARVVATENDAYRSAYMKASFQQTPVFTDEERQAVLRMQEVRAASEGTTTAGGFAIPVFIDPSIILTDQETDNPFLDLCRTVQVNTNQWKGVSAAGMSWSFDAEATEVSDDMVTLAQPVVDVLMARGFIPYSIEIEQDWPGFAAEMGRLMAEGYNELLVDKFTKGSGSGEPTGIITKLDATAGSEVLLTTAGAFGQEDIYKAWKSLPQKYRNRATWLMCVDTNNRIRQFATANVFHAYTVDLTAQWSERLFGRTVRESPYFTDFTSTTGHQNVLVVGDFSGMVIARGRGMTTELVPHLIGLTANRPTGQRGLFAHARIGSNVVNTAAFRLLNQT